MALTSTFYDGVVTESDRAKNLAGSPEYGVYGPEDFKVTAHPSIPYAVLVKAGRAHGHGVTDTAAVDQVVQCATIASGVRWDLIVVRRNWQPELGGPSTLEVVQAGVEPQIPAGRIVGPGIEDDQPIFLVKWQGGVSAPVEFRDLRVWAGNGGLYAKHDLVRSYMNSVGTEININGTSWTLRLAANDDPEWSKGNRVVNASLKDLHAVTGLTEVTTNVNGDASIPVTAFLSTVTNVHLTDATTSAGGAVLLKWTAPTTGTTAITLRAFGTNGGPLPNYPLTISWTMFGLS